MKGGSTGSNGSSGNSAAGSRRSSNGGTSTERSGLGSLSTGKVPTFITDGSPARSVTYNNQKYITTINPSFGGDNFVLFPAADTHGGALFGKPSADGAWVVSPARNVGFQKVILNGTEYTTYPLPTFTNGDYKLYPTYANNSIGAHEGIEVSLQPDGHWKIEDLYPETPQSTRSQTPVSPTPSPQPLPSPSPSPTPSSHPSTSADDGAGRSALSKLWDNVKGLFHHD